MKKRNSGDRPLQTLDFIGDRGVPKNIKDVAYFFNHKFYDKAIEKGNLK